MKWFVGVLLVLLAALVLESGLLAYAMYVLLGLLLVSRWLARNWVAGLSATRRCRPAESGSPDPEPAPAEPADARPVGLTANVGDRVVVDITVRNEGALPVPWLLLEDLLPREALDPRFPRLKVRGKRLRVAMLRAGAE